MAIFGGAFFNPNPSQKLSSYFLAFKYDKYILIHTKKKQQIAYSE